MRFQTVLCICGLVTILVVTGCPSRSNPAPITATADQITAYVVTHPKSSAERIEHGRQLVLANCDRCHGYPAKDEVTLEKWAAVVPRMCRKTSIEATHYDQVLEYFQAVGKR